MKKIAAAAMSVCLLACMSLQLNANPEREFEIVIKIVTLGDGARAIDMGEKWAYAVPRGAKVKWSSEFDFILQFAGELPFDPPVPVRKDMRSLEITISQEAKTNHLYKYTVFAVDKANRNTPLVLDPVIIIIPPRN